MSKPTATRRRLDLPDRGVGIALLDWGGDGPLALLHHANGFCAALWEPVALALRERFRVVAMDARGHGRSSAPEGDAAYTWDHFGLDAGAVARALLAERGEDRAGLALGHSFGGTSLMLAASRDPELFEALVMVDPVLHPPPDSGQPRSSPALELADRTRKRQRVFDSREAARAGLREKDLFAGWQPRSFEIYLEEGFVDRPDGRVELACDPGVEAAVFRNGVGFDAWAPAERVTTRTLILWAEGGNFPRFVHEAVASRMADARVHAAAAGHLVLMEDPDLVVREVLAFVGERPAQRSTG
ncbi:MAG: alpha/beta fold hydrolase [Myxococcota bacterium]